MKLRPLFSIYFTVLLVIFLSCKKECTGSSTGGNTTLTIRMGDDPVDAEEVNIDLQEVKIKVEEGK